MIRGIDVILAFIALLIFSPAFLLTMIVLSLTGEREIFYRQLRIGRGNKPFHLLKFATMKKNSAEHGGQLTTVADPRVLPVGSFLRATKLNELPQLINILRGDMSIIGPRPQTPAHFAVYPDHVQATLAKVRPGLSGLGSIVFRDEEQLLSRSGRPVEEFYADTIAPHKGELEAWSVENRSVRLYVLLILLTIEAVINPGSKLYRKYLPEAPLPNTALAELMV